MLINLEWPRYIESSNSYITAEENEEMKKYLEVAADGYSGILDYQGAITRRSISEKTQEENGVMG